MKPFLQYYDNSPSPGYPLPISTAVRAGDLIFVSGHASVDADNRVIPGTFEEEFRRSVEAIWLSPGLGRLRFQPRDFRAILRLDAANVPRYNELYREYFRAPFPARTTITGCLPPALHFEIECVAVLPRTGDLG